MTTSGINEKLFSWVRKTHTAARLTLDRAVGFTDRFGTGSFDRHALLALLNRLNELLRQWLITCTDAGMAAVERDVELLTGRMAGILNGSL